ncbi:MAG TPA: UDP-3-O-(3-hydroxymyristoyl)glucosamine N-acyltransferase [Candidatus Desulfofervidus auxilii]|uniref:UDP-3-O-acylglucosamine N-acyltransferase n=1 Tax=Desulfofervidus auxilii TaxID=1621989 RepID=A0A7V0IA20_DESA2|nr:UDP-3-O-(3-hydroxymyristoyl)glucosamine N-acyltransferase [Candidatus Desulfofervidus auxilii]
MINNGKRKKESKVKLREITKILQAELIGDGDIEIKGLAPIEKAKAGDITFIANPRYKKYLTQTQASAVIVPLDIKDAPVALIRTKNPYLTYARVAQLFYRWPYQFRGISSGAFIAEGVRLGKNVTIYPFSFIESGTEIGDETIVFTGVYIGPNVKIGKKVIIYPNVSILADCEIGSGVIIHSGAVIGSDGFGFAPDEKGNYVKIPQLGRVRIEDDVEIGANTTIDRAALGETVIKKGTKIDNLVQIAHNVEIGENSIIVAQVGIAGSTKIGNRVTLAGQVGVVGHIEIGDGVTIGAKSGVPKSVSAGQTVASGVPAMPYQTYLRTMLLLPRLPEFTSRLKKLEKELTILKNKIKERYDEGNT